MAPNVAVRGIAIIEGVKGLLVLLVGFGLMSLAHHDVEQFLVELVRHIHLNPASHYPRIFIEAATSATNSRLWLFALAAFIYAAARLIEAYGLWKQRYWAEVFAVLSGSIYLPVEIYQLIEQATPARITVLSINSAIVAYLSFIWWRRDRQQR